MATRKTIRDEAPIKHTAGGEMPDIENEHHVNKEDLETMGDFEDEALSFAEQAKTYIPAALTVIGVGVGAYLLYRFYGDKLWAAKDQLTKEQLSEEESDFIADEGKRAQQVSNVQPSRLLGA